MYYDIIKDSELKWYFGNHGYAVAKWIDKNNQKQCTFLHEAIIQLSGQIISNDHQIDHKDGNKLNCLDDNLRICTYAQNNQNKDKLKTNTSGYKGVHWHKDTKKWQAQISINCKLRWLGNFDKIEDAAKAYNVAASQYYGEFAKLNNI